MLENIKSLTPLLIGFIAFLPVVATCVAMDYLWHLIHR